MGLCLMSMINAEMENQIVIWNTDTGLWNSIDCYIMASEHLPYHVKVLQWCSYMEKKIC